MCAGDDEMECDVYRSPLKENLYLYLPADEGFGEVPTALMDKFGSPEKALSFTLHAGRQLAKEDPELVLKNLKTQGYHLQLPPADGPLGG